METPNPATPPNGATPGSVPAVITPPAAAAPATTGTPPAGTVTISTEEFAKLQRDSARVRSFGTRVYKQRGAPAVIADPNDPNASAIAEANAGREAAEKRALQLEVKGKVRDLLSDDRFKGIPESTKKLILERPQMLSEAESIEDAMFDIEDRLIELAGTSASSVPAAAPVVQAPRETPPVRTAGAPAPVDAGVITDVSNLRGPARSVGTLKNVFAKAAGAGQGQQ